MISQRVFYRVLDRSKDEDVDECAAKLLRHLERRGFSHSLLPLPLMVHQAARLKMLTLLIDSNLCRLVEAVVELSVVASSKVLEGLRAGHGHRQQPDREALQISWSNGVDSHYCLREHDALRTANL